MVYKITRHCALVLIFVLLPAAQAVSKGFPIVSALPGLVNAKSEAKNALSLQLCGQATLKAYKIFTVGESALYRPDCQTPWSLNISESKLMYFRYGRDIPANAFAESAMKMLDRNIRLTDAHRQELAIFHQLYRDVSDGDTYTMSYSQDDGLQLFLNNVRLGELKVQPLAHQYFSIWLGQDPFDKALKRDLLGQ